MIVRSQRKFFWLRLFISILTVTSLATLLFCSVAYAASKTPLTDANFNGAMYFIRKIAGVITNIFNPIALVSIAGGLVKIVVSKNVKSTEMTIAWLKRIIVVFIIFNSLYTIFSFITKLGLGKDSAPAAFNRKKTTAPDLNDIL